MHANNPVRKGWLLLQLHVVDVSKHRQHAHSLIIIGADQKLTVAALILGVDRVLLSQFGHHVAAVVAPRALGVASG